MKNNRRILISTLGFYLSLGMSAGISTQAGLIKLANASVTKVGNGDDGADLESLAPVTSGPIVQARESAANRLRQLNVSGIPGLGLLVPELEHSELLMAAVDTHSTGEPAGSFEVSPESKSVYARTFAEPYAATRFFPAALKLSEDQLVALQIHEALHRALPASIRTNENIVMHLTMAMTSPGASFDRVRQVATLYMPFGALGTDESLDQLRGSSASASEKITAPPLPERTRPQIEAGFEAYGRTEGSSENSAIAIDFANSLGGPRIVKGYVIEPILQARLRQMSTDSLGPSSFALALKSPIDEEQTLAPFFRLSLRSLNDTALRNNDRDLSTIGLQYANAGGKTTLESEVAYSFGNRADQGARTKNYGSIFSIKTRWAQRFGRINVAALADFHASEGNSEVNSEGAAYGDNGEEAPATYSSKLDAFRLLLAGPEIGYVADRFQLHLSYKRILSNSIATLDQLGDVVDRGSGREILATSFMMKF